MQCATAYYASHSLDIPMDARWSEMQTIVFLQKSAYFSNGDQGSHRLEKSLNIKSTLKSIGKSLKSLEKSLNSSIFF